MVGAREFLERLRPSGTPGAAALAGVPADRVAERSAELEPLLAQVEDTQALAARIRADADAEALRRRDAAAERARALLAQARRDAEGERRAVAAAARSRAQEEGRVRAEEAAAEAARVSAAAAARMPALVDRIVADARRELAGVVTSARAAAGEGAHAGGLR